jgi:diaminopimelate decarboxylase
MKAYQTCNTSIVTRNGFRFGYRFHQKLIRLHAGYEPEKIFYTQTVFLEEIEEVNAMGVQINIDNLSILEQFGTKYPNVPVCRINPHVMAGGNANISVGHIDSKFGISVHQLPHLVQLLKTRK